MKDDLKQEARWAMQLANLLADHLTAMGADRVEMAVQRAGREFLITVEHLRRDAAFDDAQHFVTNTNISAGTRH